MGDIIPFWCFGRVKSEEFGDHIVHKRLRAPRRVEAISKQGFSRVPPTPPATASLEVGK
jgi:hypothetical protein